MAAWAWRELLDVRPPAVPWRDTRRLTAAPALALVAGALAGRFTLGLIVALGA